MIDKPTNFPITSTADTSTAPIYAAVAANAKLTQDAIKAAMTPDLVSVDLKANYNTTTVQSQVGLQFGSTQSTTSVTLGDRVVDTSLIHKIRSRSIHFSAYHLKPLTRLYAFFDNINVDHYISSCYRVTVSSPLPAILKTTYFSGTTGGWTTPPVISSSIIAKQSIKEILFHKGSTFFITQYDNPLLVGENISLDGISYKILTIQPPSANLMTDENGYIAGTFMIPNDVNLSFNTGSRAFLLCDSPNNTASQIKTSAEFIYYASGILQTKEAQTLVTRINQVTIDPVLKSKSTAVAGTSIAPTSLSASSPLVLIIDKAGPLVTGRSPIIGATGVDSNTIIKITFNEEIIPGSGDITIQRPNGSIVESFSMPNTNVSIIGKVLTITPTVELASLDTYIVNLPTGSVKDALGNDYIKETTVYSFTIKSVPIIYPTITTYSPTKGATGVEVTAPIILTFNKEIVIGSGSITLKQANGTISTTVISAKGNQLTIIPTTNLSSLTSYIVMLPDGCVVDLDGNHYAGSSDYTFTCKNIDTTGPIVQTFNPNVNSIGFAVANDIKITFNKPIQKGTGNIVLYKGATQIQSFITNTSTAISLSSDNLTLIVNPTNDLESLTQYKIILPNGCVKDLSGNNYLGTSDYTFTTINTDATKPTIVAVTPSSIASSLTQDIVTTFSESITASTGTIVLQIPSSNGGVATIVQTFYPVGFTISGSTLTLNPSNALLAGTSYQLVFSENCVQDLNNNPNAVNSSHGFNTAAIVDTTPIQLAITSTYPVYDAYGAPVSNDFNLIVVFNQPIKLQPDPNYTTSYCTIGESDPNCILIPVTSSSMQITNNTLTIPIKGLLNGVSYIFDLGLKHITALTYIDDNLSYILGDALSLYFTASGTKPNHGPTYSPEFNSKAKISTHRNWIGITFKEKMKHNFPSLQVGTITGTGPGSAYSSTLFSTDSDGTYFKLSPPLGDFLQGYVYSVTINANTFSYAETPSVYWGGTSNWTFTLVGDSYVPPAPNPSIGDICHTAQITRLKGSTEYCVTIPFASVGQEAFIKIDINTNAAGSGSKYIFVSPSGEMPTSVPSYISNMGTDAYTIMGKSSTAKIIYQVKTGADSSTLDVKICSNVEVNITPTWVEVGAAPDPVVDTSTKYAKITITQDKTGYFLPGIKGLTGWEHWSNDYNTSMCNLSTKNGLGSADQYRTIHANPDEQVNNGDAFLYVPAGSSNVVYKIINESKDVPAYIKSITYVFSEDVTVSPLIKKFGTAPFKTELVINGKPLSYPYKIEPNGVVHINTIISWDVIKWIIPWNTGNTWDLTWGDPLVGKIITANTGTDSFGYKFIENYKANVIAAIAAFDKNIIQATATLVITGEEVNDTSRTQTIQFNPKENEIIHADPLAQTFYVNVSENPDGYFVSSVDLFFAKKSNIDDITVQLRPTVNGIPSSDIIIPFATTSLAANDVKTSTYPNASDPNSYTKFRFDSPIFLLPGMYAIVIISPSKEYEIFTATMGGFRINNSDMRISDIPYCGDLFKSSNGSTWLPSPSQDMCFVLNRCNFTSSGSAQFISEKPYVNYTSTFNTFIANTYYSRGDYIRVESGFNMDHIYEAMNTGLTGPTAPDHINGDVMNGLAETGVLLRFLSNSTRNADINVPYDTYFSQGENVSFKNAEAKYFYKGTNTNGTLDADFTPAMLSTNYDLDTRKILDSASSNLRSKIELTTKDSKLSPIIDIARFTNVLVENIINNDVIADDFISHSEVFGGDYIKVPVKGMYNMYKALNTGTTSVEPPYFTYDDIYNGSVLFRYLGSTHNGDTELLPSKGRSLSKYITRKVILADGFESTDITVTFNAFTPYGSSVKVYYKAAFISGGSTLEETPYYEMVLSTRDKNYASQFVEHKYICDYGDGNIRFALPNMNKFNQFIVKIVMLSANSIAVPKIRDLRVIALDD